MGSHRDIYGETLRENSPLQKALEARGLTLQDIIDDIVGTSAENAYEHSIRDFLDRKWFASLEDLISLTMDSARLFKDKYGEIMAVAGEPRQKVLSEILQKKINKLDRKHVIEGMVKARKIGRHKDRYLHRDVITGSWKTVGATIIEDLGISHLKVEVNAFVKAIHDSELKVKKVGAGEVFGYLEYRSRRSEMTSVKYMQGYFKAGQGRAFRGRPRNLTALIEINAPKNLEKKKREQLGIPPRSRSSRNRLY
jgi:hypothetical protein